MKQKILTFLVLSAFFCLNLTNPIYIHPSDSSAKSLTLPIKNVNINAEYIYVRVLIDGVWWIWVYDEDGNKIMEYIDDEE